MNEAALITRDDAQMLVALTPRFSELRDSALSQSALIGKVHDELSNAECTAAMVSIQNLLKQAEEAREEAKRPSLEFGRRIDNTVKEAVAELKAEQHRLSELAGNFQYDQLARQRAAESAENERLTQIERDKNLRLSTAQTPEEVEQIHEQYAMLAASNSTETPIIKAEGQRVQPDWEITVNNIWLLAKAHPMCVKVEAINSQIKVLLNSGVKVAGVTATPKAKVSVRASKNGEVIPV